MLGFILIKALRTIRLTFSLEQKRALPTTSAIIKHTLTCVAVAPTLKTFAIDKEKLLRTLSNTRLLIRNIDSPILALNAVIHAPFTSKTALFAGLAIRSHRNSDVYWALLQAVPFMKQPLLVWWSLQTRLAYGLRAAGMAGFLTPLAIIARRVWKELLRASVMTAVAHNEGSCAGCKAWCAVCGRCWAGSARRNASYTLTIMQVKILRTRYKTVWAMMDKPAFARGTVCRYVCAGLAIVLAFFTLIWDANKPNRTSIQTCYFI